MDEPRGHYAKWNKPVAESWVLHEFTCVKYLKQPNTIATENRMVDGGDWEEGKQEIAVHRVCIKWISFRDLFYNMVTIINNTVSYISLPKCLSSKEVGSPFRGHRRHWFDPWVRKFHWSRKWQPTLVFLPGKSHGKRTWWATVHRFSKSWTCLATHMFQN